MTRPRWTTLRPFRRRRRVHVVLWGARAGDLQAGSPAEIAWAQLLDRQHRMFHAYAGARRALAQLGLAVGQVVARQALVIEAAIGPLQTAIERERESERERALRLHQELSRHMVTLVNERLP